ncbi:MAG: SRPBCC family protein [Nocardioides sp.]
MAGRESLVVIGERAIPATAAAVWRVVADPAVLASLDPRLRLKASVGEPAAVGSAYDMSARGPLGIRLTTHTTVTEAEPGVRIAHESTVRGRPVSKQRGDILPAGDGVVLRWAIEQWPPPRSRRAIERLVGRELETWLEAVGRAALTTVGR